MSTPGGADPQLSSSVAVAPRWWVYVLVSTTAVRTYVGIATDPDRRLAQHNGDRPGGARSTRSGRPWTRGALFGPFETRGEASRHEHAVKRLRGRARLGYAPIPPV